MTDEVLSADEQSELDDIADLLADPSLWGEPSADLEQRVVAAVRAEATNARPVAVGGRRRWVAVAGIAAAAALLAGSVTALLVGDDAEPLAADVRANMIGTDLAPDARGDVAVTAQDSGLRIDIRLTGLPRRDGGDFYQVWLKDCAGTRLVPAGSFHELDEAIAWAGVGVDEFPLLTVTKESAVGGKDSGQGSSGEVVATATLGPCPS